MPKTILVADDSVTIRKVVELTFRDTDIRVEAVATGREAMEKLAAARPDLVLADVVMPEPSGYEICRAVKSSEHPVPVLLLAGTFEPFDEERARACGADGHIVKPFESRVLLGRIEELLARPPAPPAPPEDPSRRRDELEQVLDEVARETTLADAPLPCAPADADVVDVLFGSTPPTSGTIAEDPPRAEPHSAGGPALLSDEDVDRIVRLVIARLSEKVLREVAWEVVPDLAESIIRERLRELEQVDADPH